MNGRGLARCLGPLGLLLVCCIGPTSGSPSPTELPSATSSPRAAGTVSGAPSPDPASSTLVLPDEFAPTLSYVSPDGRFVAARARDWGRVVLYRITPARPSLLQLASVAEVRGFADQVSWLEDSSAVLVGSDLDPTHSLQNHDSTGAGRRIAMLNTDGRVVIAPSRAREVLYHRAHASSDGRWIAVSDQCCIQQILLLSRDGTEVRRVAGPAQPADRVLGFAGWDRDGLVLYWEIAGGRSTLVAANLGGIERYRISAPVGYPAVTWGILASSRDRSWQLVELSGGMGSSFRARGLLIGRDLRPVPEAVGGSGYGAFAFGDEIVYADRTGAMRAYDPLTDRLREIPLQLDVGRAPATIGVSDGYFVWMELMTGYVADLRTGRRTTLPLQQRLNASFVDGARLAEYHAADNSIVIFDLAAVTAR